MDKKKQNIEEKTPSQTAENAPQQAISPEEQLMRRQSAPRPTAESEARRMYEQQQMQMMQMQSPYNQRLLKVFVSRFLL